SRRAAVAASDRGQTVGAHSRGAAGGGHLLSGRDRMGAVPLGELWPRARLAAGDVHVAAGRRAQPGVVGVHRRRRRHLVRAAEYVRAEPRLAARAGRRADAALHDGDVRDVRRPPVAVPLFPVLSMRPRVGRLIPWIVALGLALDAATRLIPIDLFAFRAW